MKRILFVFLFLSCKSLTLTTRISEIKEGNTGAAFPKTSLVEKGVIPQKLSCDNGYLHQLNLNDPPKKPTILPEDFYLPQYLTTTVPSDKFGEKIRLDICTNDDDQVTFVQIYVLFKNMDGSEYRRIVPGQDATMHGLYELAFGKTSNLLIEFKTKDEYPELYRLKSVGEGENSYIYFVWGNWREKKISPFGNVAVGMFNPGDPFADFDPLECDSGSTLQKHEFVFSLEKGKINMSRIACTTARENGTVRHSSKIVIIRDYQAPEPYMGKEFRVEPKNIIQLEQDNITDLPEIFYSDSVSHHNSCDSFRLKLPHAEYAFTSAIPAGSNIDPDKPFGCTPHTPGSPVVEPKIGGGSVLEYLYFETGQEKIRVVDPQWTLEETKIKKEEIP